MVVNPGGLRATFVRVDSTTNGAAREATYRITPPGGSWDAADSDTYTITTRRLDGLWTHIKTIRLEALPDPALVKSGPGRADNGNFALSRIRLFAEHADGTNRREVKLTNPRASFQQNDGNLSIAASLDALESALREAEKVERTTVLVIDTDPLISTEAGGHWWDVAVPEVSVRPSVNAARKEYEEALKGQRL